MHRRLLAGFLVWWITAAAAFGQEAVERRKPASGDGTVKITNVAGAVRVIGWHRDSVAIQGVLGPEIEELTFTTDERATKIRVVPSREYHGRLVTGTDLEVRVPAASHVAVRTAAGPISISGVFGAVDLESVEGRIEVAGSPRFIHVRSVGGDIDLQGRSKVVRAHSMSGAIRIARAAGYLDVSTVSGEAIVRGRDVWEGKASSISGDLRFEGDFSPNGSFTFESNSGDIELVLSAGATADFDVTMFGGQVELEGPVRAAVEAGAPGGSGPGSSVQRRDLSFSIGGGGALIKVKTYKGDLRIVGGG